MAIGTLISLYIRISKEEEPSQLIIEESLVEEDEAFQESPKKTDMKEKRVCTWKSTSKGSFLTIHQVINFNQAFL